jgi:predicted DNA-binding protein (MmcQ/YjbR family)
VTEPFGRSGQRTFCAFEVWRGRPSIAFKLSPPEVRKALRRKSFFSTPYGRGLWVSVWVDGAVNWRLIAEMVERSYRLVAGERLLRAFEQKPRERAVKTDR